MLRSTAFMTLALAFAAPAAAEAPLAKGSFEGQAFEYLTREAPDGTILIEGRLVQGEPFAFKVRRSGSVVGEVGDNAVAFNVSKAVRERLAKSLSARRQMAASTAGSFPAGAN